MSWHLVIFVLQTWMEKALIWIARGIISSLAQQGPETHGKGEHNWNKQAIMTFHKSFLQSLMSAANAKAQNSKEASTPEFLTSDGTLKDRFPLASHSSFLGSMIVFSWGNCIV